MSTQPTHTARKPLRRFTAALMAAFYLLILLSPLASFAMHGTKSAVMAVRECTGDCDLCGCSPASRAAHTCCCAKKRMQQNQVQLHDHDDAEDDVLECCKKERAESRQTIIACGCPCGDGRQAALSVSGTSEVLPFHFTEEFSVPSADTTFINPSQRLTSRHGEPPDPPPKLV
jgi:hypothetical protein